MEDYNRGIRALEQSVNDLNKVKEDIKNKDFDQVQSDWRRACIDLGEAYIYMPNMKDDPNLSTHIKLSALEAYRSYTKAAVNPSNGSHITALSHSIQKLIEEMKKDDLDSGMPEWK